MTKVIARFLKLQKQTALNIELKPLYSEPSGYKKSAFFIAFFSQMTSYTLNFEVTDCALKNRNTVFMQIDRYLIN